MKNVGITLLLSLLLIAETTTGLYAQPITQQRIIIIMMDGFGENYYRNASMPFLNEMEKNGLYKVVPSLMPAVTNVNNMSIATGTAPGMPPRPRLQMGQSSHAVGRLLQRGQLSTNECCG
jgi:hypothetical protein